MQPQKMVGLSSEPSIPTLDVDENYFSDGKTKGRMINNSRRKVSQHSIDLEVQNINYRSGIPRDTENRIRNR
jgi:hypothetical protein